MRRNTQNAQKYTYVKQNCRSPRRARAYVCVANAMLPLVSRSSRTHFGRRGVSGVPSPAMAPMSSLSSTTGSVSCRNAEVTLSASVILSVGLCVDKTACSPLSKERQWSLSTSWWPWLFDSDAIVS